MITGLAPLWRPIARHGVLVDRPSGALCCGNQPLILAWNLARLAETLVSLFDVEEGRAVEVANARLDGIAGIYRAEWLAVMAAKLGLAAPDAGLADGFRRRWRAPIGRPAFAA